MSRFLVLYRTPTNVLDAWSATDPAERKALEEKMRDEWNAWIAANKAAVTETAGAGKTTRIDKSGASDSRNDIMLFSIVEAASQEDAAKLFINHPHLGIPESHIEVMAVNALNGLA
jgi:hypothetical protein